MGLVFFWRFGVWSVKVGRWLSYQIACCREGGGCWLVGGVVAELPGKMGILGA